jgi:2,4-dienoyl-CoA reductase-like NADH-dependent reductase (Old Yellow Enzyme family)
MTKLFDPLEIGPVEVPNRIAVAPMCQYSAHDGCADVDWHGQHLMNLAMSGAGLVVIEATAVERPGRITHGCLGLWDDATEAGVARMLAAARRFARESFDPARQVEAYLALFARLRGDSAPAR